jgi:glycosyltransferase involved in cell wall biosynthesis
VITSNVSCLPEAGGPGSYYVDPSSPEQIAAGMRELFFNNELRARTIETGWQHAQLFAPDKYVSRMMKIYESIW